MHEGLSHNLTNFINCGINDDMPAIRPFTAEQARLLVNLRQRYEAWMEADRARAAMPYDLRRKTVSGKEYLYRITDRGGNGRASAR